ncbi:MULTISPECIES: hypothetical protein [unclassified Streptomyces]|uniref:hypothetical protein n=1 Tax=unclassified Streptomyces TaxID=2593676 RepID=UPI0033B4736E
MNTTAAAIQANVTTDTIRTWCRIGAVAAIKQAGRWVIDAASLAHRIAIGKLRRRKERPLQFTVDTMTAIGGSRWTKAGKDRVYINDWAAFAGLEVEHYKSGNISWAAWRGEKISNSQAYKLLGSIDKVWFDAADGKLHCRHGHSQSSVATPEEVWNAVVSGIRSAIAAL